MDTKEREEAARYALQCRKESLDELIARTERAALKSETQRVREARRTVPVRTVLRELKMSPEIVGRLRIHFGLPFLKEGSRYYYNLAEVARAYLEAPTKWKLNQVKDECERYLKKCEDNREYFRQRRARKAQAERAEGTESTGTQLALQDAEEAEARTREERDKLREEVAELREKIEHLRNDVAYWRGDAEGQEEFANTMAKELDEVNENWGKRKRELAELSRKNAELAAQNVELQEQIRELEHEKHCEALRAEALAVSRDKWKASSEAMAEALAAVKERTERTERTEGGSGGNAEASL